MKIYTKKGDKGTTSLGNGTQIGKDDIHIEALGTLDELNAALGYAVWQHQVDKLHLEHIQGQLLQLGAELCLSKHKYETILRDIELLEWSIDFKEALLTPLTNFILPGGSAAAAWIHHCRGICRRAERCLVALVNAGQITNGNLVIYLNRLSDFLFVLARYETQKAGAFDRIWKPPAKNG